MSWSLLGRFFGVPFLIVAVVVGGAVAVVFLFGGPAAPQQQSVEQLLNDLESTEGEKSAGILLPQEKNLWQKALELSERLRNKETELRSEDLELISIRLARMVRQDIGRVDQVTTSGEDKDRQKALRSARFEFLIRALSRTETPLALDTLIEVVQRGKEPYVAVAMHELGNLAKLPHSAAAVMPMVAALQRSDRPETLLVGSTAISVLAEPQQAEVIDVLASIRLKHEGEVAWSAALALARLGSPAGRSTLLDMLDRTFWTTGERYEVIDDKGQLRRYPMPPERVEALLIASVSAAANLQDPQVWEAIEALGSDSSHAVRGAVMEALAKREATAAVTQGTT